MNHDTIPRGLNGHSPAREGIRDRTPDAGGINSFGPAREGARDRTPGGGGGSRREGWKD